jgi:hypothetical protein
MLQYLINLTGIWLLSLAVFDLFLRKESYHNYNRLYLLATMLAGMIVPLLQWQDSARRLYPAAVEAPMANVIKAKGNVVAAARSANNLSWEQWLLVLYIAGMVVAAGLLLKDIIKLVAYYRSGRRSGSDGWTVVETGNGHAPFSFFNLLFVCSKIDYSAEEWQMILQHERRHTKLRHFVDLLLLQLSKVAFWFHPLVYIYSKRLLLVHEYQADHVGSQRPQVYGRFLVEQAVLHAAPSVTHSFNRSPIKKRIVMLTRKSSSIAKGKMLVLLPLAFASILCFSQNSFSQKAANGEPVVILGNYSNLSNHASTEEIIADPILRCTDANCEIVRFSASILCSDEEKDPFHGPFTITGAKIPKQVIDLLKEHKGNKGRVFLEDIYVKIDGKEVKANSIVLRYDH